MKQTFPAASLSMLQVSRFLVIAWVVGPLGWLSGRPGVQSYKLSETPIISPINLTNSDDPTVAEKVEKLVEKNLVHDAEEESKVPDPEQEGNSTNSFADLAKNLEFMMLKMAQVETVVQLQQAEIAAQQAEIDALKEHVGLDVQHVAMARKHSRDPHAASHVLKAVLDKHHHQRETREYHPGAHKEPVTEDGSVPPRPVSQAEALLQRQARSSEKEEDSENLLDESLSSKWNPFDELKRTVNKAVEAVDGTGLTGGALKDAFNQVKAKGNLKAVEFIQNTVIDTVEKATTILMNFKGFSFSSHCWTAAPGASVDGYDLSVNFGKLYCSVTLVGKTIELFNTPHIIRRFRLPDPLQALPEQIKTVARASGENVGRVFGFMHDILHTGGCNRADTFHCIAARISSFVMQFQPPLNWLPEQIKTVAEASGENVGRVFGFMHDILNTGGCNRADTFHCIAKRLSSFVMQFEPPLKWLPSPVGVLADSPLNSIKSLMAMGKDLMHCQHFESGTELTKCLGSKIVNLVPPLSYLNRLGEVMAETIEAFAKAATALLKKALKGGTSLIQKAAISDFPAVGKMPVRHQQGDLIVEAHSQELHPSLLEFSSNDALYSDGPGIKLKKGDDVQVTNLITQFNGREANSGSCLAFAPRNKNGAQVGNHQEATKGDWTAATKDDFVQLEPWAVPCDNTWMKDNWNKWQGYSFYTGTAAVEKCLSVTFKIDIQPVVAFVAGLSIKFLPTLFDLITTVCWPNQMPGGLDLSVLRSELKTGDHLLFSRTLRLAKRFGSDTHFVKKNLGTGYQTWRSPLGIAKGESRHAFAPMSLLEGNRSQVEGGEGEKLETESWYWKTETEDLYLASVDYDDSMEVNTTWEMRGADAARHLSAMQEAQAQGKEDIIQLFNFKKPGMTNFHIQGLLNGNSLELGLQMGFGPYQSPSRRIPLADIGVQFAVILAAVPWISVETKKTAIAALRDFSTEDAGRVKGLPLRPGSVIALHCTHNKRYLSMGGDNIYGYPGERPDGIKDWWAHQRFTVVDAGNGQIALHNAHHNRFLKSFGSGLSPHKNWNELPHNWGGEKWNVVDAGNGQIALQGSSKVFLKVDNGGGAGFTHPIDHLPAHYTWERFTVVAAEVKLVPGSTVALYNTHHRKFIAMRKDHLEPGGYREGGDLPEEWTHERFTVIQKNGREIALHNARHNRFIKVNGASPHKNPDQFPQGWGMEAFEVWPAVDGEMMLWNPSVNRFVQMGGGHMGESGHPPAGFDTRGWAWERFRVVHVKPYLEPGTVVGLHSAVHNRFLEMRNDHWMYRSPEKGVADLPNWWSWQHFKVVDAGNGQIGLYNEHHRRYVSMRGCHKQLGTHHERHGWESFTVVPGSDLFDGVIALHNSHHNCFIRMTAHHADASSHKSIQDLPHDWNQERFHIVKVGVGNQASEPAGKHLDVSLT
ncbi:unnamed protein product [Symbiodinium microadriaticum]|nr:unnamed protein product [Symbiodinium microadriaticum]